MHTGTIITLLICVPLALFVARQLYLEHKYFGGTSKNGRLTCRKCNQQFDHYSFGWYNGAGWHEPMKKIADPFCGCYKQVTLNEKTLKLLAEAKNSVNKY